MPPPCLCGCSSRAKCRNMGWPSAAFSLGQLPGTAGLPCHAPGLGMQEGPGPVMGPRRRARLRKLVTFPRADSQARARHTPAVSPPSPGAPPWARLLNAQAESSLGAPRPGPLL